MKWLIAVLLTGSWAFAADRVKVGLRKQLLEDGGEARDGAQTGHGGEAKWRQADFRGGRVG